MEWYGVAQHAELKRKRTDESTRPFGPGASGSVWTLDLPELRCAPRVAIKNALGPVGQLDGRNVSAQRGAGIGHGLRRRQSTIADMATFKTV